MAVPMRGSIFSVVCRSYFGKQSKKAKDRKSTRLNSSHGYISYAVFCLKKKKHSKYATFIGSDLIPKKPVIYYHPVVVSGGATDYSSLTAIPTLHTHRLSVDVLATLLT